MYIVSLSEGVYIYMKNIVFEKLFYKCILNSENIVLRIVLRKIYIYCNTIVLQTTCIATPLYLHPRIVYLSYSTLVTLL